MGGTLGKETGGPLKSLGKGIAGALMTGLPRTGVMAPGRARGGLGGKAPGLLPGPDPTGHSHPCKGERAAQ